MNPNLTRTKSVSSSTDEAKGDSFSIRLGAYPISANERIREVVATFELENMPLTEQNIQDLRDIESARTTTDELRKKTIAEFEERKH